MAVQHEALKLCPIVSAAGRRFVLSTDVPVLPVESTYSRILDFIDFLKINNKRKQ